jgi:hypothetical protein
MSDRRKGPRDPSTSPHLCGYYGHRNNAGRLCAATVVAGTRACPRHSGTTLVKAKAKGAVVLELRNWGLGDTTVDPGEAMLRLVSQSAARVDFYSGLLREAYDAAERLRLAEQPPESDLLEAETARLDLERIMNTGGVSVLIGHTYAGTQTSGVIATGEAIRGLAKLEADERDRLANFASKAVAAGLAERMTRLAEKQGAMLAAVIAGVVGALGLDPKDPQVAAVIQAQIGKLAGVDPRVIEGSAA